MLRRNVLILHSGALGDFVLTWPLALALGRLYPQSRIIYVTQAGKGRLAERVLGVEWADLEQGWHGLFADAMKLAEKPARMLAGAHCVVSFLGCAKALEALAPGARVLNLEPPTHVVGKHASAFLLEQVRADTAIAAALEQMLHWVQDSGIRLNVPRGADVVLHPGSGSAKKCWPLERFIELAERLKASGRTVRAVIGEVELERWSGGEVNRMEAAVPVVRPADYRALLDELSRAAVVVANDSGPGHLAGIIGVPTVALFGPTDPVVWRPLGPKVRVVVQEPLAELSVDAVLGAVDSFF